MQSAEQQAVALDTRFSRHRTPGQPAWRKTYLRRRLQLLSGGGDKDNEAVAACSCCRPSALAREEVRPATGYLQLRAQLLRRQFRAQGCSSDLLSTKSFSFTTGEARPSPSKSVSFHSLACAGGGVDAAVLPASEAFDFHGFHHLSDLHRAAVTHLKFAHNSTHTLLAASMDGSLSVHRLDTEPPSLAHTLQGHAGGVTDFDISTSNELVVSCSEDGTVCLWRLAEGRLLRRVPSPAKRGLTAARFLPGNNNLVVTGGLAGHVQLINISTGIFPASGTSTVPGSVLCLEAAPQDGLVWAGTDRGTVLSFRVDEAQGRLAKGHRMTVAEGGARRVTSLACRAAPAPGQAGLLLVSAGEHTLQLYSVTDLLGALSLVRKFPLVHSDLGLRSAFAPIMSFRSGDCVVSASEDGAVYFFDLSRSSKTCINKLEAHSCPALAVAFNCDESFLATSDTSGLVIVWKR
jgi:WD40 repeat protein